MRSTGFARLTLALILSLGASAAFAQYIWLDNKGVKQYSDRPPPTSVPTSKILKAPGTPLRTASEASTEETEKDADLTKKAPPTLADKNADFQKRRIAQAEKDKETEQKTKQAADQKKNCERATAYNRILESGQRVSRMDQSGERVYLSDEEREQEIKESRRVLNDCK